MKIVGLYLLIAFTPARAFFYSSSDPIDCVWLPWRYTACIRVGDGDFRKVENRTKIEAMFGGRDCISQNSSRTTESCSPADYITSTILSVVSVRPQSRDIATGDLHSFGPDDISWAAAHAMPRYTCAANARSICDQTFDVLTGQTRTINYQLDTNSPEYQYFVFHIRGTGAVRLRITFTAFDFSKNSKCPLDHLQVYDGPSTSSPSLIQLCGNDIPTPIETRGNVATIKVVSGEGWNGHRPGFVLQFTSVDARDICSQTFDVPAGQTRTINYLFDTNYAGDQSCVFHIRGTGTDQLRITFTTFDLERNQKCSYDYLHVYDGPSTSSPSLNKLCGNEIPATIETQDNVATLKFVSDGSVHKTGFILTAKARSICSGTFDVLVGETRTINYMFDTNYPGDQTCVFHIRGTGTDGLRITFTAFDLETESFCEYDYLEVYDGPTTSGSYLRKLCGNGFPAPIETQGNVATLRFVSDGNVHKTGFILQFTTRSSVTGDCARTFTDPATGIRMLGTACNDRRRSSISTSPAKSRVKRQFGGNIVSSKQRDVLFLVDESASVGETNFRKELDLVKAISGKFCDPRQIGRLTTRVALTGFSSNSEHRILFSDIENKREFRRAIEAISYRRQHAGRTCLIDALRAARNKMFTTERGSRVPSNEADGLLVLITDGCPNCHKSDITQALQAEQKLLAKDGIGILTFMVNVRDSCEKYYNALQDGNACFQGFRYPSWAAFHNQTSDFRKMNGCINRWTKNAIECP